MATPNLTLPKVATAFEDKEAGARVDKVFSHLAAQLPNLKVGDASSVGGVPADVIAIQDLFYQTFESDITSFWNLREGLATNVSYTTNGKTGGRALRATGEVWYAFPQNIPFNPERLYRMRGRVRMVTAPSDTNKDLVKVGVEGVGADGTTLVNVAGADSYDNQYEVGLSDEDMGSHTLGDWVDFTTYFKGVSATPTGSTPSTSAAAPRTLDDDVRYIRPFFALNYDGGNGVMEIDYIEIDVLTETPEVNDLLSDVGGRSPTEVGNTVRSGGGVAANQVYQDSLRAGIVTAAKIAANTITASQIAANTITASRLASLSGGGLTIDFDASGSDAVLSHSAFTLKADGSATFSGTVTASSFQASSSNFWGTVTIGRLLPSWTVLTLAGSSSGGDATIQATGVSTAIAFSTDGKFSGFVQAGDFRFDANNKIDGMSTGTWSPGATANATISVTIGGSSYSVPAY